MQGIVQSRQWAFCGAHLLFYRRNPGGDPRLLDALQKAFTKTKPKLGQKNTFGVVGEGEASLVCNAVIFPVDVKPMQMRITPTHGDLNRVMKVGNAVIAPQEQSPPDHWANAAQDDLELVNAQHLGAWHAAPIVPPPITPPKAFFPNSLLS